MNRFVVCLVYLCLAAPPLWAQKAGEPVLLTVRPAELPQPSLKYPLFPSRSQQTEGNAPTLYYRTMCLFVENPPLLTEVRAEHWETWLSTPLNELPRQEVAEKLRLARRLMRELELAGRCKRCDWQLDDRSEGIGLLLPEVQSFRPVSRILAVRARLAIAEGRYAEACESLQAGYALAHHLGQGPTLIHVLVGMAVANLMTTQLESLLQQPDAPNLYWSLAVMPQPFADLKPALYNEVRWLENMFPWLKNLDGMPMSEAAVKAAEAKIQQTVDDFGVRKPEFGERVARAFQEAQLVAEAKRELVAHYHLTNEQVAAMPTFQVGALYTFWDWKEANEEVIKWAAIPEGWKHPAYLAAQQRYSTAMVHLDQLYYRGLLGGVSGGTKFPLESVSLAVARVERRFAALRCVEAIRQYAAKHDGKLPATLAEVKELPIPNDPLTHKPFEYAADGDKATLALAKLAEGKADPKQVLTYYLTLKPGKK